MGMMFGVGIGILCLTFWGEAFWFLLSVIFFGVFCDKFVLDFPEDILLHSTFFDPRFLSPKKWIFFKPTNCNPSASYY